MQGLLSEGMFTEILKPRFAVCERALKVSRKLRYAGRMLKKISVPNDREVYKGGIARKRPSSNSSSPKSPDE